jgi:homocysteine S-methyltransferase
MIKAVHRAYLDAGADVVITSSYQASIEGFRKRGVAEDDVGRLFQRTLKLAHVRGRTIALSVSSSCACMPASC